MWWFSKTALDQKIIILYLDGIPVVRSQNGVVLLRVVKVNALPKAGNVQHVQVCFEDGSTVDLPLADFDAGEGSFTHNLRADMDAEQFAEEFAKRLAECNPAQGHWKRNLIAAAIGGPLAVGATVVALPVIGFGAGGIAAGSYAASMMSAAAAANGGGVVAGGLVATLQSVGAAGLGLAGNAAVASAGAAAGAAVSGAVGAVQDNLQKK